MAYDAVVFDHDGVLVEPTEIGAVLDAIESTFEEFGVDPPEEDVGAMLGVTADELAAVCAEHGVDPAEFWRRRDANASRVQREAVRAGDKPLYGDVDALADLPADLGVVSNNQHETVEYVLEFHGIADRFRTTYGREPTVEGIRRKKPNPYYLRRALSDLGADDALYVGDSNVDVAAADAAGIDSAFVRRPHREGYDLEGEPTYELDGLDDLPELLDGRSPSGPGVSRPTRRRDGR